MREISFVVYVHALICALMTRKSCAVEMRNANLNCLFIFIDVAMATAINHLNYKKMKFVLLLVTCLPPYLVKKGSRVLEKKVNETPGYPIDRIDNRYQSIPIDTNRYQLID